MKYQFNKTAQGKINCPYCQGKKCFRVYENNLTNANGDLCGRCDRLNACGIWIKPDGSTNAPQKPAIELPAPITLILDAQQKEHLKLCLKNQNSNFHKFCFELGITPQHLRNWGVGTENEKTLFAFIDQLRTPCNIKYFKYLPTGKRDKDFKAYSLKGRTEGVQEYRYKVCLFGEHLLSTDTAKPVIVVESEKTAIIAAYFYPQFTWLSCASADGLTDAKAQILKNRIVIWLCDADKAGRDNSSLRVLKRQRIAHKRIDLNPALTDGTDIADLIISGERPDLDTIIQNAEFEGFEPKRFISSIRPRQYLKMKLDKRLFAVKPTIFKNVLTDDILQEVKKLDSFLKIRTDNTENIYDLEFLALVENVLYHLKLAYHTELNFNRTAWMQEVLREKLKNDKLTHRLIIEGLRLKGFLKKHSVNHSPIPNYYVPNRNGKATSQKSPNSRTRPTPKGRNHAQTNRNQKVYHRGNFRGCHNPQNGNSPRQSYMYH